jgi:hypothetical protein
MSIRSIAGSATERSGPAGVRAGDAARGSQPRCESTSVADVKSQRAV